VDTKIRSKEAGLGIKLNEFFYQVCNVSLPLVLFSFGKCYFCDSTIKNLRTPTGRNLCELIPFQKLFASFVRIRHEQKGLASANHLLECK